MFKDKLKGILIGTLIGAMLTGGISAIAVSSTTLYNVINQGIKIVIDGEQLNPKDANGNPVEPLIYNGTTYLPVRAVASALGKAVYWDGPNYTVYLGEMNGKLEYPTVMMTDLTSVEKEPETTTKLTDNYGNRYGNAVIFDTGFYDYTCEYLLNMQYSRFKATLYVPEGESSDNKIYFSIIADGKNIYTSPAMTKSAKPVNIDVNIKGCNDIKLIASESVGYSYTNMNNIRICLANPGFYQ